MIPVDRKRLCAGALAHVARLEAAGVAHQATLAALEADWRAYRRSTARREEYRLADQVARIRATGHVPEPEPDEESMRAFAVASTAAHAARARTIQQEAPRKNLGRAGMDVTVDHVVDGGEASRGLTSSSPRGRP